MKSLVGFLFLVAIGTIQTHAQNKFFHELKGFEDSAGTTHLFYRVYEDFNKDNNECGKNWRNDIFHLNTTSMSDSLLFESFYQSLPCSQKEVHFKNTPDFNFLNESFEKKFSIENHFDIYGNTFGRLNSFNGSYFDAGGGSLKNLYIVSTDSAKFAVFGLDYHQVGSLFTVIVTMNGDSLPSIDYDRPFLTKIIQGEKKNCDEYQSFFCAVSDSLRVISYSLKGVDELNNKIYIQRNDSLFFSEDFGNTINFLNAEFKWSEYDEFIFSNDSTAILVTTENSYLEPVPHKTHQIIRSLDNGKEWFPLLKEYDSLAGDTTRIFPSDLISIDGIPSWDFYAGVGYELYYWNQLPSSFYSFYTFESEISGIYIKSGTGYLNNTVYVLTKNELFEYKNGIATSLKELPLSNEESPELPTQISLHQNYPNPFNPVTTIQFELVKPAFTQLTIYDALGRKVRTLAEEMRPAGINSVSFDASDLASGIYLYRLEADGLVQTRKMMLVK